MIRPVICWVTDRRRLSTQAAPVESFGALVEHAVVLAEAGVNVVQIRERDLEGGALSEVVERCVEALKGLPTRVLVNDRFDVAVTAGAHGVHLRGDSIPSRAARSIAPPGFLIGRSVHSAGEAVAAAEGGGLDYVVLGTVFPSASKPTPDTAIGAQELERAAKGTGLPVIAIGGITEERLQVVARTGAAGFAAIGLFTGPGDRSALAARARRIVEASQRLFDTGDCVPRQ